MTSNAAIAESPSDLNCQCGDEPISESTFNREATNYTVDKTSVSAASPDCPLPHQPSITQIVDALLKAPELLFSKSNLLGTLLGVLLLCHLVYGLIVGSYSGAVQWFAAPTKIVLGTVIAGLLCLPSLYIFSCLSGAQIKLSQAAALLCGALALASIMLLGFAPIAFIFTFSTDSVVAMGALHIGIWFVAIGFGVRYVIRGVAAYGGRAGGFVRIWAIIFVVCLLQMSTTLRPILGSSDRLLSNQKLLFVHHWLDQIRPNQTHPNQTQNEVADSHDFNR